ncbi:MAG: DinB family protein [Candidatus Acidiferrales bacterium]
MKRLAILMMCAGCLALTAVTPDAAAQQAAPEVAKVEPNPVSSAVRSNLERNSKNILAAVDEMPADKFGYRPTPEQITFGHLVMHMAGSNFRLCSAISGMVMPKMGELKETDPKEKLAGALKSSFDFCTQALAKVDDSNLGEVVLTRGTFSLTRAGAMIALTNDFADHYSGAAMYLRLNGLLPPTAQPHKD